MATLFAAVRKSVFNPRFPNTISVKRRLRTADCRPGIKCRLSVKCRLQTGGKTQPGCKMQSKDCRLFQTFVFLLLQIGKIASQYQLHTALPSRSAFHIHQKFQWTTKQLKFVYLDLQYFQGRSSKFPAEHLSLQLEWSLIPYLSV